MTGTPSGTNLSDAKPGAILDACDGDMQSLIFGSPAFLCTNTGAPMNTGESAEVFRFSIFCTTSKINCSCFANALIAMFGFEQRN
jgi:hypothetical protein